MVNCPLGPIGIIDFQPQPNGFRSSCTPFSASAAALGQDTARLEIAIDPFADKVIGRIVSQLNLDIRNHLLKINKPFRKSLAWPATERRMNRTVSGNTR